LGVYEDRKKLCVDQLQISEQTRPTYLYYLTRFNDYEEKFSQDLYDFDEERLLDVIKERVEHSVSPLAQLENAYKDYIEWGKGYFNRGQEPGHKINLKKIIEDSGMDEKSAKTILSRLFTREQLELKIVPKLFFRNNIDKSYLLLAFEGIYPLTELLALRSDAYENRWLTIPNGRKLLLTKNTANIVNSAIKQTIHTEGNGESLSPRDAEKHLLNTGYIFRTDSADEDGKFNKNSFYSRINYIKKYTGEKYLSFSNIHKAGILDYFFLIEAKKGNIPNADDRKRVCKWLGENTNTINNWTTLGVLYSKYKDHFNLGDSQLEERRSDKRFDDLFAETQKIVIDKKLVKKRESIEIYPHEISDIIEVNRTKIHKAILDLPNPEKLSEEEDDDTVFQKNVSSFDGRPIILPDGPRPKPKKNISTGNRNEKERYPRDPEISKAALIDANFQCQFDPNHISFVAKKTNQNYVEAHHLIPIRAQDLDDLFDYSIDVPENIFALCPTCHREIHHASDRLKLKILKKLYTNAEEPLVTRGIHIKFETLCRIYGVKILAE
jgi:hypothetical protein